MARNYEKRFTGLNRFLEAKQKAEGTGEEKRRPPLHKLTTADDVKKWIPSIQVEIEYLLQQLTPGVKSRSYPDYKIAEFEERLEKLEREHKRFVSKVHALDPGCKVTPWQQRGYARKRPRSVAMNTSHEPLHSALLEKEAGGINLVPDTRCTHSAVPVKESEMCQCPGPEYSHHVAQDNRLLQPQSKEHTLLPTQARGSQYRFQTQPPPASPHMQSHILPSSTASSCVQRGALGLDYSSSDEDQSVETG
eukprot:Em0011g141a